MNEKDRLQEATVLALQGKLTKESKSEETITYNEKESKVIADKILYLIVYADPYGNSRYIKDKRVAMYFFNKLPTKCRKKILNDFELKEYSETMGQNNIVAFLNENHEDDATAFIINYTPKKIVDDYFKRCINNAEYVRTQTNYHSEDGEDYREVLKNFK